MRVPKKNVLTWVGVGLAAVVLTVVVVRTWVIKGVIVGQIQARTGGVVEIEDWWLNGSSAGVKGLKIRESSAADSPVWASAERATTDLTLGRALRLSFTPGRIDLKGPELSLRFDEKGALRSRIGGHPSGGSSPGPIPVIVAEGAKITLQQQGRPAMVVSRVTARLGPHDGRALLSAQSSDPNWGPAEAHGDFDQAFQSGTVDLATKGTVAVSPEKVKAIPFVPAEVWANVAPTGNVDAALKLTLDRGKVHVHTEIGLDGTTLRSDALALTANGARGRIVIDDTLVNFVGISGTAIDGTVTANGKADFGGPVARFDLVLKLDRINVVDSPKLWQLDELGVTGLLTGKVHVLAKIGPAGVDLTGTSGDAVIDHGTFEGIAVKNWRLTVVGAGNDLTYDAPKGKTGRLDRAPVPFGRSILLAGLALVAFQAPDAKGDPKPDGATPKKPAFHLPKSITTHLELEDVELAQLVTKAQFLTGFPFPIPISGRLSLNADATIPLGNMKGMRDYAFHGDLVLTKTSAYKVDLGRVSAHVDLADGVLELKDLRGHLVNHPDGGPDNPPEVKVADVPASGPLPPGGFRGTLRAAFAPPGKLTARFEGNQLPLGELGAPILPRPTPLAGLATMTVRAEADLGAASDPAAWDVSGTLDSKQITYKGAELDSVAAHFGLKNGRVDLPEFTALLGDRPLRARLGVDLKPPQAFRGVADVAGWDLADILKWVPSAPRPSPVLGTLSARAEASGTLSPLAFTTDGRGSFERLQAGPVTLGAVPFHWATKGDVVALDVTDARPFGGKLSAHADVPTTGKAPIKGSATVSSLDTAALAAAIPGGNLKLTGLAGGKVTFTLPPDGSALDASVHLSAPDLTVQGLPAEHVKASVRAQKGSLGYDVSADSLGGVIKLKGAFPLGVSTTRRAADGELQAVGFLLERAWPSLGVSGALGKLSGRGAIDSNVRAVLGDRAGGLYAHGYAELRDLRWGDAASLGSLRGVLMMTPAGWRIDRIAGDLLGGVASGSLWGSLPSGGGGAGMPDLRPKVGFSVRLDRAELIDAAAFLPLRGLKIGGFGTLRVAGTLGDALHATGDLHVAGARVGGLAVNEVKIPLVLTTTGGLNSGALNVRRYTARVAGGSVHGDALVHIGVDRSFKGDMVLTDVDLESITRIQTESKRPASGKISGRVSLYGHDYASTRAYRGKVNLTLDDASLVAVPIFRELDKFLGSAQGGLFEQGDLNGTIANRELVIETATLQGRLAQLHVSGTVGFDSQLNLEVLVNTNQLIPQAGSALAGVIPGLRDVRNPQANLEVTNYLSNKLLKLRVTGTLRNPSVNLDPGVAVAGSAVGFFSGVLKLPLGLVK